MPVSQSLPSQPQSVNEKFLLLATYALISEMASQNGLRYLGTQLYFDPMTIVARIIREWERDDFYSDHGYAQSQSQYKSH